jgi:hypothetical protein
MRIIILGGPRCGKTRLAAELESEAHGLVVRHTDELVGRYRWSECSEIMAADWMAASGSWLIEGVAAARGVRKWLAANPHGFPCERVMHSHVPKVPLTPRQLTMLKGCVTVWSEIRPELLRRGVKLDAF